MNLLFFTSPLQNMTEAAISQERMNMKQSKAANLVMAAIVLVLSTNGCSLFAPKSETVTINSEPQGAEVLVNNSRQGTTPCNVSLNCKHDATIVVRKQGYESQVFHINSHLGTCGIMDIVGTALFLFPAVGLFSAGAYTLDQHNIYAPMSKASE